MNPHEIAAAAFAATGVENASHVATGGQKWVYRATLAGNPVVLKIVGIPTGPMAPVALERARREVDFLSAVESEGVVRVLSEAVEIGERPEAVAWVEEFLDGEDVARLTVPLDDAEVLDFLRQVSAGLAACHTLSVVHRDLSPGNIRRTSAGAYKVMDPGLARHIERTVITGVYQPGTPGFRSPEHIPGGDPTPASDVFCLGILAFWLRTGELPIDPGGTQYAYDQRLAREQAASISTIDPTVAPDLAMIIDRCLQRQPARRFLDGQELSDEIERVFGVTQ
ncbi:serine/threonine-protein kinase [Agromyces sp. ZXT2-6]|uniref:serine/threonine-protein kinase n=1 Tax=Agromyces sp. ZXT2-6 TaxID=3461153 RepID=UPI004054CA17